MNIKKIFIILAVIFVILCIVTVIKLMQKPAVITTPLIPPAIQTPGTSTVPVTPLLLAADGTIPVKTDSGVISITDIRHLKNVQDVGVGMYHLQGSIDNPAAGFAILYSTLDNSFSISIEAEPVAINRELAGEYFLKLFNVTQGEACHLKVWIGVPYAVNHLLAGQNLGFSFCPNSITI